MIKNLILSGGSTKGFSFIGIFKALYELNLIKDIRKLICTSIGALMGLSLVCKYVPEEMEDIIINMDIGNLLKIRYQNLENFINNYGLIDTKKLIYEIENVIFKKTNKHKISFKDFYNYSKIEFNVTILCLNDMSVLYCNHINTPDFIVSNTIATSISIPLIFKPTVIDNKYYIDAGILNNFPISILDNSEYNESLLIKFKDTKNNINNLFDYLYMIIKSNIMNSHYHKKMYNKFPKNKILEIDTMGVKIFDLALTKDTKIKLIENGYKEGLQYLKKKLS